MNIMNIVNLILVPGIPYGLRALPVVFLNSEPEVTYKIHRIGEKLAKDMSDKWMVSEIYKELQQ